MQTEPIRMKVPLLQFVGKPVLCPVLGHTYKRVNTPSIPMTKPHLRVLSWNIHKGVGGLDRRYDLGRTIAVLEHYAPDIVMLQEVAQGIKRLNWHDQVETIAAALNLNGAFYPEHRFRFGAYGNLILARWPIHESSHVDLTVGRKKTRGMVQAHITLRIEDHQRTIVINNLHLGLASRERGLQLDRMLLSQPLQKLHRSTPVIVGGDLNDLWGTLGPQYLLPMGFERAGRLANTFPSALPLRPLDGLFYRGALRLENFEVARTRLAHTASDHRPIYADFVLLPD